MLLLGLLFSIIYVSVSFAQPITDEQEIFLPDYILSPTEELGNNNTSDLAESFEDELANLLKFEQQYLPKFKFTANIFVLNKNTNKVTNYSLQDGLTTTHKSIQIKALNCLHNYNNTNNNDYVFLKIINKNNQEPLYNGWMSVRLPGLAPFNHQTYSIIATKCKVSNEPMSEEEFIPKALYKQIYEQEMQHNNNQPRPPKNMNNVLQPLNLP